MVVGTVSRITLHVKVNMDMSHQYNWLIPSDSYLMLKQTQWEVVVQMVLRSCIFLEQKRANSLLFWHFLYMWFWDSCLSQPTNLAMHVHSDFHDVSGTSIHDFKTMGNLQYTNSSL